MFTFVHKSLSVYFEYACDFSAHCLFLYTSFQKTRSNISDVSCVIHPYICSVCVSYSFVCIWTDTHRGCFHRVCKCLCVSHFLLVEIRGRRRAALSGSWKWDLSWGTSFHPLFHTSLWMISLHSFKSSFLFFSTSFFPLHMHWSSKNQKKLLLRKVMLT